MPPLPLTVPTNKSMRIVTDLPRSKEIRRHEIIDTLKLLRGIEQKLKHMLDLDT